MAPIRRYLRITKYSVLETRIYLDNPSLVTWLLNPRPTGPTQEPLLQRIINAIRPLVLPKLREENEAQRNKTKGKKKKNIKDTVVEDDFEVAIFLTNNGARHSLCVKGKVFKDKTPLESNSNKLMRSTENSTNGPATSGEDEAAIIIREESDDERLISLKHIPDASTMNSEDEENLRGRNKRRRSGSDALFIDDDYEADTGSAFKKIRVEGESDEEPGASEDDKKKMAMNIIYDGFSIHGKALCLVVKRKDSKIKAKSAGQAMMEDWMTATQTVHEDIL